MGAKGPKTPEPKCERCGHLESEHGQSGTRPCLAMVGDLLNRKFCRCNRFKALLRKAA
jgi:hypothetical protein